MYLVVAGICLSVSQAGTYHHWENRKEEFLQWKLSWRNLQKLLGGRVEISVKYRLFSSRNLDERESGQWLQISPSEVMMLNLKNFLSDLQIIMKSTCGCKRTQRHYVLSYFSSDCLGENGWWVILPVLSIQNVCGWMSSEKCSSHQLICLAVLSQLAWTESSSTFRIDSISFSTLLALLHGCKCLCSCFVSCGWEIWLKRPLPRKQKGSTERDSPPHCPAGLFLDLVCRNSPSATPAQLRHWSSAAWASTKKLCVYPSLSSVLVISGVLKFRQMSPMPYR